jgi:hypothetical protein
MRAAEFAASIDCGDEATAGEAQLLAVLSCADNATPPPLSVAIGGSVDSDGLATAAPQLLLAASLHPARYVATSQF